MEFSGGSFKTTWHTNGYYLWNSGISGIVTEDRKGKRIERQEKDVVCQEGVSRLAVVENYDKKTTIIAILEL